MDSETEKLRSKQEQGTQNPTGSVDVSDTKGNFSPTKESQNNPPHDISKKDPPQGADSQDQGSRKLKTRNGVLPEPTSTKRLLRVRSWHRSVQASSLFRRKTRDLQVTTTACRIPSQSDLWPDPTFLCFRSGCQLPTLLLGGVSPSISQPLTRNMTLGSMV